MDNAILKLILGSVVRATIMALAGYPVVAEFFTNAHIDTERLVAAMTAILLTVMWSVMQKLKQVKTVEVARTSPPMSKEQLTQAVKLAD